MPPFEESLRSLSVSIPAARRHVPGASLLSLAFSTGLLSCETRSATREDGAKPSRGAAFGAEGSFYQAPRRQVSFPGRSNGRRSLRHILLVLQSKVVILTTSEAANNNDCWQSQVPLWPSEPRGRKQSFKWPTVGGTVGTSSKAVFERRGCTPEENIVAENYKSIGEPLPF